jgi:hypothetical protein
MRRHKMASHDTTETVATYRGDDGKEYEIDHLGICYPSQRGDYAVYCDGEHVAEFSPGGLVFLPEDLDTSELIRFAKEAVAEATAEG